MSEDGGRIARTQPRGTDGMSDDGGRIARTQPRGMNGVGEEGDARSKGAYLHVLGRREGWTAWARKATA